MAKRKNHRATNHSDFAGPDAEKEAIERLAKSAAEANAKAGHNSGEVDEEVLTRNTLLIKEQLLTLDELLGQVSAARGVLGNRKKVAKKDGCDVDAIMLALKYEKRVKNGGASPVVAEHRQIGRILRILDCPLGTQFKLFDLADDAPEAATDEGALERKATLAGEQAGLNGEPVDNCPHTPGTPQAFGWRNGWQVGADKLTASFGNGKAPAPAGTAAH